MADYIKIVNSPVLYLIVAGVLSFITIICIIFLIKSYKAGISTGMDKKIYEYKFF